MSSSCFAKPRTIAGKRASPVRGITIFPTLDRRSAGQLACESPPERHPEVENHSRSCSRPLTDAERPPMIVSLGRTPPENVPNRRPENPASETLDTWERSLDASHWRHSFKMPITTTVLSRNNASRQCLEAPSARDPVHEKAARRRDAFSWRSHGQRFIPENRSGPQPTAWITRQTTEPKPLAAAGMRWKRNRKIG